ncbi:MAG: T9SS type A sorting domain-containing protein [Bacteroidia bacterium]|nr:T9SS type A sorting domain-containing protein [Bacteroidia bacterium]MDW8133534.1 T9SS type A sorting domain-containing protein [Bacteroidia bacterium]
MRSVMTTLLLGGLWAQIQIGHTDLPNAGSTYTVSQVTPRPGLDFVSTGANHIWDFSQLPSDTQLTIEWKSPLQVPQYFFNCGNASWQALLYKVADSIPTPSGTLRDLYAFCRKGPTQMVVSGLGMTINNVPITQCYQDEDEMYVLPIYYGRRDSTTFRIQYTLPSQFGTIVWARRGYKIHLADGYGEIRTPYGQFNCLRLREDVREWDTVYFNNIPVQSRDSAYTRFEWLGQGQGVALLQVEGRWIGTNFIPLNIQYKDNSRASSLTGPEGSVRVLFNSARGELYVMPPKGHYVIRNLIGQIVAEGDVPATGQIYLPSSLPEGIYFLRLVQGGRESWHRFALTK